ncbi:hypothetical protein Glove_606g99 [Diversispora epigaea]|uniref:BTB domain-containing protein n=1 Tax=Diversispora epigaea TaxID=1348612 RepID=A0A397G709_9GLOM|nr:hypothetical protein Glove_606g99 [Diversispora epigaea]
MPEKFFDKLLNDLQKLFENSDNYDVIIEIGNGDNQQSFKVHSAILCYRCPYLYKELDRKEVHNKENLKTIEKPNLSIKVFDIIIRYIYYGIISLENIDPPIIFDLLITANEYSFEELILYLQSFLIENYSPWLHHNFSKIYNFCFHSEKLENLQTLQKYCDDIILKCPKIIFEFNNLKSLSEIALISLIKRDNLQLDEIEIWNYLIQWGKTKNPNLPDNLIQWTNDDFLTLKNTVQKCLPYIRYFQITGDNIIKNIKPYQQILPSNLWDDLMQYFIAPHLPVSTNILPPRNHQFNISSSTRIPDILRHISPKLSDQYITQTKILAQYIPQTKLFSQYISSNITSPTISTLSSPIYEENWEKNNCEEDNREGNNCEENIHEESTHENNQEENTHENNPKENKENTYENNPEENNLNFVNSNIITRDHMAEIASWIDKTNYNISNIPYDFKLLYCGSTNGFDYTNFWDKCNKIKNILIILKVKNSKEILGGFNPIGWNVETEGYTNTNESFIFSLKNDQNLKSIISRVINPDKSIRNNYLNRYGPIFGEHDFVMYNNFQYACWCIKRDYEQPIRDNPHKFIIDEYEAFQIIKKH